MSQVTYDWLYLAGQQLVFGEQIGWLSPSVVREQENAAFLRQVVRLRYALRRYFHAGEMARPPRLAGDIPRVTADWQWHGETPVTTDALLTGAWQLPQERKLVILLVNVSDAPVQATLDLDVLKGDLPPGTLTLTRHGPEGSTAEPLARTFRREIALPPRQALGLGDRGAAVKDPLSVLVPFRDPARPPHSRYLPKSLISALNCFKNSSLTLRGYER